MVEDVLTYWLEPPSPHSGIMVDRRFEGLKQMQVAFTDKGTFECVHI